MGLFDRLKDALGGKVTLRVFLPPRATHGRPVTGIVTVTSGATPFTLGGVSLWLVSENRESVKVEIRELKGVALPPNDTRRQRFRIELPTQLTGNCRFRATAEVPGLPDPTTEGAFVIEEAPTLAVEEFEELVAVEPEVHSMRVDQTEEERLESVESIPADVAPIVQRVIVEHVSWEPDVHANATLAQLMKIQGMDGPGDEISAAWTVRIHRGPNATLVDANGRPGDNQRGAGIVVWPDGRQLVAFTNYEDLEAHDPGLRDAVRRHHRTRWIADVVRGGMPLEEAEATWADMRGED